MADGLVARYAASGVPPPAVLYTDRECCGPDGSMFNRFFHAWRDMKVRKDIWHFMGRLAEGYTSVHHDQYHSFWPQLSTCIFSYDESDMNRLLHAKRNTLLKKQQQHVSDNDIETMLLSFSPKKLHCRRHTRGVLTMIKRIEELISSSRNKIPKILF